MPVASGTCSSAGRGEGPERSALSRMGRGRACALLPDLRQVGGKTHAWSPAGDDTKSPRAGAPGVSPGGKEPRPLPGPAGIRVHPGLEPEAAPGEGGFGPRAGGNRRADPACAPRGPAAPAVSRERGAGGPCVARARPAGPWRGRGVSSRALSRQGH